jgi:YcxB-like protein
LDITVELPPDPQRLVTSMRIAYREDRAGARRLGVIAIGFGAALIAAVFLGDGDGWELVLGAFVTAVGVVVFRYYDEAIARGVRDRPAYAQETCTIRLTDHGLSVIYPNMSSTMTWRAVTAAVHTKGFWLFFSDRAVVLALPAASLGQADGAQLRELLAGRTLLRAG